VDDFGHVTLATAIAYPRRQPIEPEEARVWATFTEATFVNHAADEGWYRHGVPIETRTSELTGLEGPRLLSVKEMKARIAAAREIPFEATATTGLERRVFQDQRYIYTRDDLAGPLPLGEVETRALPYETHAQAFTPGLLRATYSDRVDGAVLRDDGGYVDRDGVWWAASGHLVYSAEVFFQPIEAVDPWRKWSLLRYDHHALLVIESEDALANRVRAEYDYRVLAPRLVVDPNDNRTATAFDARGMVVRLALMGKEGAAEGDTLDDATHRFEYDPLRYVRTGGQQPASAHALSREEHGSANKRWLETYTYSDGSGREAMRKVQAPATRWIGTGRSVFDNKGNPVKRYEPFFSSTHEYETEQALVASGVTPILRYDPLGRLVRTDLPNGTFETLSLDAWGEVHADTNDNVLESEWYARNTTPSATSADRRAARLTAKHAHTPTVRCFDALRRPFLVIQDNGRDGTYGTRYQYNVQGQVESVTDARGNVALQQRFDLGQHVLYSRSADAGERVVLQDVGGRSLRSWDARGFAIRNEYDGLRRRTHTYVHEPDAGESLAERVLYGETVADAVAHNQRGRRVLQYDGAGEERFIDYDFKGNLVRVSRRLARVYDRSPDWASLSIASDLDAIDANGSPLLEAERFETEIRFDALNRLKETTTPDASTALRAYDETGLLERRTV
jgi:YD repeat-containing protein